MNKIIGALVLAIIIVVLLYAGFTKVMTLSAENETLKQNVITLTQTNEQNLKAIADMKELSDKVDSLTIQLKHMAEIIDTTWFEIRDDILQKRQRALDARFSNMQPININDVKYRKLNALKLAELREKI